MAPLGIAFAGAGKVAELHRSALSQILEARLIGFFEPDATRRQQRKAAWNVTAYSSLAALLSDPRVEAVFILSPAETHLAIARQCLDSRRHVLIEKPVARDADGIDALAQSVLSRDLVAMPGHNYAWIPEFQRLVRLTRRNELGTVRAVWITYAIAHPESVAATYAGVLEEVMAHHAYLTLALLGPPDRIHAGAASPAWSRHPESDQAWMTWDYGGSTTVHLFASFAVGDESADPWTFIVKCLGTAGSASMTWRSSITRKAIGTLGFGLPVYEESYEHEARAFVAAVRDGGPLASSMQDAATVCRIITAAVESARSGHAVTRGIAGASSTRW